MQLTLTGCMFVLESEKSANIKKNDRKILKLLVTKKEHALVRVPFDDKSDIKELLRNQLTQIIGSSLFHLEQVYTMGTAKYYQDQSIDILYLALINMEQIKKLRDDYELVDFAIKDNKITIGNEHYSFKTVEKVGNNNVEYFHEVDTPDVAKKKQLVEIITVYKYLKARIDYTDIVFKLLPTLFTLEDVRLVYEMIKEVKVDKSNFRKKIVKYCEKSIIRVTGLRRCIGLIHKRMIYGYRRKL